MSGRTWNDPAFRLDFLGIGAGKSGTTWLADVLRLHPDVFIPATKELIYFNRDIAFTEVEPNYRYGKPLDWYHAHFKGQRPGQIAGELSPTYLVHANSAADIHAYNPDIRLVAILRDPLRRSFSQFQYFQAKAFIPETDFASAVKARPYLIEESFYGRQLEPYLDRFPREQLLVLFHDDLKRDPRAFYHRVTRFLGVRDFFPEGLENPSNETRDTRLPGLNKAINAARMFIHHRGLQRLLPLLRRTGVVPFAEAVRDRFNTRPATRTALPPEVEREYRGIFRADVELTERLLGVDLTHWKG
ncbi:MAG: sulfotransferase [Kiritimatiellia bacterium]